MIGWEKNLFKSRNVISEYLKQKAPHVATALHTHTQAHIDNFAFRNALPSIFKFVLHLVIGIIYKTLHLTEAMMLYFTVTDYSLLFKTRGNNVLMVKTGSFEGGVWIFRYSTIILLNNYFHSKCIMSPLGIIAYGRLLQSTMTDCFL